MKPKTLAEKEIENFINEQVIVSNSDHPDCYICNNGLCHLDITKKQIEEEFGKDLA